MIDIEEIIYYIICGLSIFGVPMSILFLCDDFSRGAGIGFYIRDIIGLVVSSFITYGIFAEPKRIEEESNRIDKVWEEGKWWLTNKKAETLEEELIKEFYDYLSENKSSIYYTWDELFALLFNDCYSSILSHDKNFDFEEKFIYYSSDGKEMAQKKCIYNYLEKGEDVYKAMNISPARACRFLENEKKYGRLSDCEKYVDGYGKLIKTVDGTLYYENYKVLILPKGLPPIYTELHINQEMYIAGLEEDKKRKEEIEKEKRIEQEKEEREKRKEILEKKSIKRI